MGYKVIIQGDDDVVSFKWPIEEETAKQLIMVALGRTAPRPREVQSKAVPVVDNSTPNEEESSEPP